MVVGFRVELEQPQQLVGILALQSLVEQICWNKWVIDF